MCRRRKPRRTHQNHTDTDMKSSKTSTTLGFAALAIFTAPLTVAADPGWYFGGSGGPSQTDVDEDRIAADLLAPGFTTTFMDDNERDTGFKVFGGYQFNKYWAMESGYYDLGDFGYTSFTVPPGTLHGVLRSARHESRRSAVDALHAEVLGIRPRGRGLHRSRKAHSKARAW